MKSLSSNRLESTTARLTPRYLCGGATVGMKKARLTLTPEGKPRQRLQGKEGVTAA
jgi:hypothetical protein